MSILRKDITKIKQEVGSVTIVTIATVLFLIIILTSYLTTVSLKRKSQLVETKMLQNAYDGDMETIYLNQETKANVGIGKAKREGEVLSTIANSTITDDQQNNVTVPAGFKIASDSATVVTDGIVIEDSAGNQFVWIPVGVVHTASGDKTINLNRYTFDSTGVATEVNNSIVNTYYTEENLSTHVASGYNNVIAKDIDQFINDTKSIGGYYIGRYELGVGEVCKSGQTPYTTINEKDASAIARSMYTNGSFTSDLTNSYAWDTAMYFIKLFGNNSNYANQGGQSSDGASALTGQGKLASNTSTDVQCNVYDMAGNVFEWTTESSSNVGTSATVRGGAYNNGSSTTSSRVDLAATTSDSSIGLRPIIYLKHDSAKISDGSWSYTKSVNTPKINGTGLIPVTLASDGTPTEVTDLSSDWYDYNTTANSSRWANAVTKDKNGNITGYFVWIPRYEYKITGTTITVKFIETKQSAPNEAEAGYLVHPAFTNSVANGGWDRQIPGFWVAKYPAGYQASTINASGVLQNASDTVVRSNLNYSGIDNGYTANAVDGSLSTGTKMSYPVFKPLTYAYNCIRIGDSYNLARDIQNASNFYGLSGVDSHMQKNSEWGAVAYLTQSSYGRNGTELNINNYNANNTNSKNTYSVTGLSAIGPNIISTNVISAAYAYNTTTGVKGSSTGNITGVYDINGCIWEYTASYITNGNPNLATYGNSFAYTIADATPQTNGRSTKWATTYPYDSSSDSITNNWTKYNSFKSATYGFGDAILETSTSGTGVTSWNADLSFFPGVGSPFFAFGGDYGSNSGAGEFCFYDTYGYCAFYIGFRVVLIS